MNIGKRLFCRPLVTALWLVLTVVMTGFLAVGAFLWYTSHKVASDLDLRHTAIAVRTDPTVNRMHTASGVEVSIDHRTFTDADAAHLNAMEGVKTVRSHTLTGGTSPSFLPIVGLNKHLSWRTSGMPHPYWNAVLTGTVMEEWLERKGGEPRLQLLVGLEDILLLNPEYAEFEKAIRYQEIIWVEAEFWQDDELACYPRILEGERYVFCGSLRAIENGFGLWLGRIAYEDGYYLSYPERVVWTGDAIFLTEDGVFDPSGAVSSLARGERYFYPAAERLTGASETFFADTKHAFWRAFRTAWEMQQHSLPVIGTDRLESMFVFVRGEANIIEGRSFTPEEYETGARVCVLSENMASRCNLAVGDTIAMRQFLCEGERLFDTNPSLTGTLNNPCIDRLDVERAYEPEQTFTVVGIYRLLADWSEATYAVTPNTVFIPRSAQIPGAFGAISEQAESDLYGVNLSVEAISEQAENDLYGVYLSVELENGAVEEFQLALMDSPYAGQFYCFDQGFEAVQKNISGLATSSFGLMWVAFGGWVLFILLLLTMYQRAQKRTLGIMRSLGAKPRQAAWYLFGSGAVVCGLGVAVGGVLSEVALRIIQSRILEDMLAAIDRSAHGGELVVSEEALAQIVYAGSPSLWQSLLFFGGQSLLILALLWIQAWRLSNMSPRKLTEG